MSAPRFLLALLLTLAAACSDSGPRHAFERLSQAAQDGEWETVYGLLDSSSQARIDSLVQTLHAVPRSGDPASEAPAEMTASERFAILADETPALYRPFDLAGYSLVDENTTGDRAILTIRLVRGQQEEVRLIRLRRENGVWRVGL